MRRASALAACAAVLLAACGGGGGGGDATPPPNVPQPQNGLFVSASGPTAAVAVGATVTLTLTIGNSGPAAAGNVVVNLTIDSQLQSVSRTCTASGGATCPASSAMRIDVPTLPSGGSLVYQLTATVVAGATGTLTNSATASAANDASAQDNTAFVYVQVQGSPPVQGADIVVSGSGPSQPVLASQDITYVMTVSNPGPATANSVTLVNTLGPFQGPNAFFYCTASGGADCPSILGTNMSVQHMPANSSLSFEITATVDAGYAGPLTNFMTASGAGDPQPANNEARVNASSVVANVTGTTSIEIQMDPSTITGPGYQREYSRANATLSFSGANGYLTIGIAGDQDWSGQFRMPNGETKWRPIQFSAYNSIGGSPSAGLAGWTADVSCPSTAVMTVNSATYVGNQLAAIDFEFTQYCGQQSSPVFPMHGRVRYFASDTTAPPPPVNPPPAGLWTPAAGATPASGSYVYLQSDAGDIYGQGQTYLYTKADSAISAALAQIAFMGPPPRQLGIFVSGNEDWVLVFEPKSNQTQIQPGYYGPLGGGSYPFHNRAKGGVDIGRLGGAACDDTHGWFAVDALEKSADVITALEMRFEFACTEGGPALRGKVRFVPGDSTLPPGPATPPSNLWAPPAGATPASGNYAYVVRPTGDVANPSTSALLAPPTDPITVGANGTAIDASFGNWHFSFETMYGLAKIQPGYYPKLRRPVEDNPVRGGADVSVGGSGCSRTYGWVVVDSASYNGDILAAIELRYELYCGIDALPYRGKIRWQAP